MNALALGSGPADPASLLSRYMHRLDAGQADRFATGLRGIEPGHSRALDRANGDSPTDAAIAQISDIARSFFDRAMKSGDGATTFDLHLDLTSLGIALDGRGGRSAEGHSLRVDLHLSATQGVVRGENGDIRFQRLEMSFTIEEMHVQATEHSPANPGLVPGRLLPPPGPPNIGPIDGQPNPPPAASAGKALLDGLRSLVQLLNQAAQGQGDGKQTLDLTDLSALFGDLGPKLNQTLQDIGHALEALGARSSRSEGADRGERTVQLEVYQETTQVRLQSLSFTRAAPPAAAPDDAADVRTAVGTG